MYLDGPLVRHGIHLKATLIESIHIKTLKFMIYQ